MKKYIKASQLYSYDGEVNIYKFRTRVSTRSVNLEVEGTSLEDAMKEIKHAVRQLYHLSDVYNVGLQPHLVIPVEKQLRLNLGE